MEDNQKAMNILELAAKWRNGTITAEEGAYYEKWYAAFDDELLLLSRRDLDGDSELEAKIYAGLMDRLPAAEAEVAEVRRVRPWPWIAVAAGLALAVFGAGWFYYVHREKPVAVAAAYANDVKPGGNKAVLKLGNGKTIVLTDAANGRLVSDAAAVINKTADGKLVYEGAAGDDSAVEFNTMTTPKGGQYQVVLSDGTSVWLNAASSLKYPAVFRGGERVVELTGEAYFAVKHDAKRPFRVRTKGQVIEDLGTEFNVNAYGDEPLSKTTLVEGAVAVNSRALRPGEQAVFDGASLAVVPANVELEVAWKNNKFRFESADIRSVMRMVERWYDVEVEYVGAMPDDRFGGRVSRFDNVSKVLQKLESTGSVHFKVNGRKITVTR